MAAQRLHSTDAREVKTTFITALGCRDGQEEEKGSVARQFEELVARIESMLQSAGAVVVSPDHLEDKITGTSREVDACITLQSGAIVTVECRDRWTCKQGKRSKAKQDVIWIEQLVTKRADLGVSKTIGVSAGGFTKAAIKKAAHYGIELRQMSEVSDVEIAQTWVGGFGTSILSVSFVLIDARFVDADGAAFALAEVLDELPAETATAIRSNPTATPFLRMKGVQPLVSPEHLFNARVSPSQCGLLPES